ncbi:hypothetical protein [Lysinibacillus phage vB_LspM-01]|nr:hypothetical protein [Lysinibacillus phage vB_LspM-01]
MEKKKYVRGHVVAEHYDVHLNTVYAWSKKGCPHKMVGIQRRYNLEEVEQWLNSLTEK